MIVYKSRFLRRGEVWFESEPVRTPAAVDWLAHHQLPRPVPSARWRYFHTLLVDLSASPEELLASMSKDTAYKIRRARDKDKVICHWLDPRDPLVLDNFEELHNRSAALNGLGPLHRARLNSMAAAGVLGIAVASDSKGCPLVYHAYYRSSHRSCALFAASIFRELADSAARNAIGRANRLLFWSEMLRSREQGLRYFDFGGWYPGATDPALLKINQFKSRFQWFSRQ